MSPSPERSDPDLLRPLRRSPPRHRRRPASCSPGARRSSSTSGARSAVAVACATVPPSTAYDDSELEPAAVAGRRGGRRAGQGRRARRHRRDRRVDLRGHLARDPHGRRRATRRPARHGCARPLDVQVAAARLGLARRRTARARARADRAAGHARRIGVTPSETFEAPSGSQLRRLDQPAVDDVVRAGHVAGARSEASSDDERRDLLGRREAPRREAADARDHVRPRRVDVDAGRLRDGRGDAAVAEPEIGRDRARARRS